MSWSSKVTQIFMYHEIRMAEINSRLIPLLIPDSEWRKMTPHTISG